MKNNSLINWLRRYKWWLTGGLVAVLLITSAVFRYLTPATDQVELTTTPAPQPSINSFLDQQYQVKEIEAVNNTIQIDVPETMIIYQNSTPNLDLLSLAQEIITTYSLEENPNLNSTWDSNTYELFISAKENMLTLHQTTQDPLTKAGFDDQQLSRATSNLLTQFKLINKASLPTLNYQIDYYTTSDVEFEPAASLAEATLAEVTITQQLDSFQVFNNQQARSNTTLLFNANYQLLRLVHSPFVIPQPISKMKTLSVDQALENIIHGNHAILTTYQESGVPTKIKNFKNITFNEANLEYRYISEQNQVLPFYRFKGSGYESSPKTSFVVTLVTPAVETTTNSF